jgi:hypothetical protein
MKFLSSALAAALLSAPLYAHHAESLYDRSKMQSIEGTVTEYLWANPHTNIYLAATEPDGRSSVAVYEGGSAMAMRRLGSSRTSLAVGDKITVSYYARRDLKSGGQLIAATLPDGRTLHWQSAGAP